MVQKQTKIKQLKKGVGKETKNKESYTAKDIFVLEGLDPVRKRPAMYIGSTGTEGVHHLIWECCDNVLDEFMGGYGTKMEIIFLPNSRVSVADSGRGIPVEKHPQTKVSALETVMTTLHAGAKFGGKAYQVSGGLHGVGISVVCALSTYMSAEVCRGGDKYLQEYYRGKPKARVKKVSKCRQTGTTVTFEPDPEIFRDIKFNLKKVLNHLRQQAYLTKGIKIIVRDKSDTAKPEKDYVFYFDGGLSSYVKYLTRGVNSRQQEVFYASGEKDGSLVEAAFKYTDEREMYEESFANNICTGEGGTHLTGFRSALTRTLNDYARKNNFIKENEDNLSGDDVRGGLTSVVSIKIKEPQFEGQTKARLGNPEAKVIVDSVVSDGLTDFLERNPQDARAIIENCLLAAKARKAAKAARQTVLRKGALEGLALPGKLADCSSRNPEESELYIVEGESAGGCFLGNTKVALADGRNISFKELVEEDKQGKKNFCYTMQGDGHIGIAPILNPRMTKKNVEVVKIILDNKKEIICTPDHFFMLRDGFYKKAEKLTSKNSLMPLYRKYSRKKNGFKIDGYEMVYQQKNHKWVYTHLLSNKYKFKVNSCVHHKDFNKLNNSPDNLVQMDKIEHLMLHSKIIRQTMARPEVLEKIRKAHQSKEYREKVSVTMLKPKMRELLSKRAKKQWQNDEYKHYMTQKFLEFYKTNKEYREKNNKLLYENQKRYWSNSENRIKWAEKVKEYFAEHPNKRKELSEKARKQWQNKELLIWRKQKTKEQWTSEFRIKRKKAYDKTYQEKFLKLMKIIFEQYGKIDKKKYNQKRLKINDKSLLRYDTICRRFFDGNEERLKEGVLNYNHKIAKVVKLKDKANVYDLEVEGTHNFALADGIFVHNSSRQARNRRFQAILPLRGKILNVERARIDKILSSKEIKALVIALGTAIAEDFNLEKLRYQRIILMSDADVDGAHIKTLLLTLFYRYFQPIIEKGYLYIAQPPLFKIQAGKRIEYGYTDADKEEILSDIKKEKKKSSSKPEDEMKSSSASAEASSFAKATEDKTEDDKKITGVNIQRYKGLGEMNPDELWETTMNPDNRVLLKVTIEDVKEADRIFDILMGEEVLSRKKFIQTYAKKVKNLDI